MAIPFEHRNFQKELDALIKQLQEENRVPTLLLHACCAPCSSYCIEYLSEYFHITVFYYNPNITSSAEYQKRVSEEKRFIREFPVKYPVSVIEGKYEPERFEKMAEGLQDEPEGGARCVKCYRLRLEETARLAKEKIYIPCYWKDIKDRAPDDETAIQYAEDIFALPIDQRYDREDMLYLSDAVRSLCDGGTT